MKRGASIVPRSVHPFPARMAAAIPWEELSTEHGQRLRVLDPMAGSGTTLAVARALGHRAIGFDTDPLAVLIAQAWCEDIAAAQLRSRARSVLKRATAAVAKMRAKDAFPKDADEETRRFALYWFNLQNRKELRALADAIAGVRDARLRVLLQCAFSRLIIAKQAGASLALDLAHSRPHRVLSKPTIVRPLSAFLDEVERVCAASPFEGTSEAPRAVVRRGDARELPLKNDSVDVVITSPPYINGIDYQRTTKFSLVWFGFSVRDLRDVRSRNVGTEAGGRSVEMTAGQERALRAMGAIGRLPPRVVRILSKYVRDMDRAICEIARVLTPGGRAVIVIGDSTIQSAYVRNSKALLALAESAGLETVRVRRRRLPPNRRYLPPPRRQDESLDGRLRTEAILHLRKSA